MELHTRDLTLRTVTPDDIHEVARMWAFEKGPIPLDEAQKAIESMHDNHKKNKIGHVYHLCFAVCQKGDPTIIGWCGLDGKETGKLHIFYLIDASYRNQGYATQCAAKLLSHAFDEMRVHFVNGGCDKSNAASYRVMKKIGMMQNAFEDNGDPLFLITHEMYHAKQRILPLDRGE